MLNALDMSGNQIKNFLAENGRVSGDNPLAAQTGRLAYDTGDRSLYLGYQEAGTNKLNWSRLVDVAHLDSSISEHAQIKWVKEVSQGKAYLAPGASLPLTSMNTITALQHGCDAYNWGNHAAAGYFKFLYAYAEEIEAGQIKNREPDLLNEEPVKLCFDKNKAHLYLQCLNLRTNDIIYCNSWPEVKAMGIPSSASIYNGGGTVAVFDDGSISIQKKYDMSAWLNIINKADLELLNYLKPFYDDGLPPNALYMFFNHVLGWGDHADAGYAKAYKINRTVKVDDKPMLSQEIYDNEAELKSSTGFSDWMQGDIVFNTETNELLCEYTRAQGGTEYKKYVRAWAGINTYNDSSIYNKEGNLLFVQEDAAIYKYENGLWYVYFSGASQDVITKIDDIEKALGLGNNADSTPDVIDTWNEIKKYFATINSSDSAADLLAAIATKANKSDVVEKPSKAGADGDVLSLQYDSGELKTAWKKHKIVETSLDNDLNSKIINHIWDIDISALDTLDVNVSIYCSKDNKYELIITDVYVMTYNGKKIVRVEFSDEGTYMYKAVIIA